MERRIISDKIKRDMPSESSEIRNGGDVPGTDEVHDGTAALRHLALLLKDLSYGFEIFSPGPGRNGNLRNKSKGFSRSAGQSRSGDGRRRREAMSGYGGACLPLPQGTRSISRE